MKKKNRPFRVLIVDDCPDDIARPYLLTHHLGCEVTLALDGLQALSTVKKDRYDLIILDWNMPIMSGHEFLSSVRARGLGMNVVLHSGAEFSDSELESIADYRIMDFWPKPMGPSEILKRMKIIRERLDR